VKRLLDEIAAAEVLEQIRELFGRVVARRGFVGTRAFGKKSGAIYSTDST
jgi:hypothetical protein